MDFYMMHTKLTLLKKLCEERGASTYNVNDWLSFVKEKNIPNANTRWAIIKNWAHMMQVANELYATLKKGV